MTYLLWAEYLWWFEMACYDVGHRSIDNAETALRECFEAFN